MMGEIRYATKSGKRRIRGEGYQDAISMGLIRHRRGRGD